MSFMIFQNEKTFFQRIKTRSCKRRKNDIFPKGLTNGFGPKMAIFCTFFFGNIGEKNVFYDILERKKPFQAITTRSSKSRKNNIFPKGLTNGFGPKIAIPLYFLFLGIIGQENVFDDILKRENAFLGYKNKKVEKTKN